MLREYSYTFLLAAATLTGGVYQNHERREQALKWRLASIVRIQCAMRRWLARKVLRRRMKEAVVERHIRHVARGHREVLDKRGALARVKSTRQLRTHPSFLEMAQADAKAVTAVRGVEAAEAHQQRVVQGVSERAAAIVSRHRERSLRQFNEAARVIQSFYRSAHLRRNWWKVARLIHIKEKARARRAAAREALDLALQHIGQPDIDTCEDSDHATADPGDPSSSVDDRLEHSSRTTASGATANSGATPTPRISSPRLASPSEPRVADPTASRVHRPTAKSLIVRARAVLQQSTSRDRTASNSRRRRRRASLASPGGRAAEASCTPVKLRRASAIGRGTWRPDMTMAQLLTRPEVTYATLLDNPEPVASPRGCAKPERRRRGTVAPYSLLVSPRRGSPGSMSGTGASVLSGGASTVAMPQAAWMALWAQSTVREQVGVFDVCVHDATGAVFEFNRLASTGAWGTAQADAVRSGMVDDKPGCRTTQLRATGNVDFPLF